MAKTKETSLIPTETGFEFVQDDGEYKVLPLHKLALVSNIMGAMDGNSKSIDQFDLLEYDGSDEGDQKK